MRDHQDGDFLFGNEVNALSDAVDGSGVLSSTALAVTDGGSTDMSISIAAGKATVAGTSVSKGSSTSKTLAAADPDDPRYDTVVIDSTGAISVKTGTPAPTPAAPTRAMGELALACVRVDAGVSGVSDSGIYDARAVIQVVDPKQKWIASRLSQRIQ